MQIFYIHEQRGYPTTNSNLLTIHNTRNISPDLYGVNIVKGDLPTDHISYTNLMQLMIHERHKIQETFNSLARNSQNAG